MERRGGRRDNRASMNGAEQPTPKRRRGPPDPAPPWRVDAVPLHSGGVAGSLHRGLGEKGGGHRHSRAKTRPSYPNRLQAATWP